MFRFLTIFALFAFLSLQISASPALPPLGSLQRRTDPYFPDTPASCPICAQDYPSINSCAQAAPVLANFSMIIFNPGAFIDIIKCACVDTFQAAFPQCVDCFIQTGQQDVLSTPDLPGVVDGMRRICALQSTLLGNVSGVNGDTTSTTTPQPVATGFAPREHDMAFGMTASLLGLALFIGCLGF
ncbi:unnamed protein product [Cyclocybe aegerita]|uniref:Uncharacterized protein n=1 Tax=Cyclocybe aegerita TaxID=1973307 RepID=A0A8S0WYI4_CYCAE|nr:unnamed protein product [Cyclocybe aegerita]